MTTQEFVISEAEKYVDNSKPVENDECSWQVVDESFSDGLTKGLEIAKEFLKWVMISGYEQYSEDTWFIFTSNEDVKTTSELLTIFLTEKYGK